MKIKKGGTSGILEGDLTPMIDMTFQLIAFFMVLINFTQSEQNDKVKLPSSVLAKPAKAPLEFPITLRAWRSGDRMRRPYGSKKLKKIFGEKRVDLEERSRAPVVVDGRERVLWIPGVARSSLLLPGVEDHALMLSVSPVEVRRTDEAVADVP